ncbi:MAG TPA: hypothetical protein VFP89_05495 [Propionibacteriaceae bacterium]|nr:hypothetical protein [Propionibacteriaceae bacterium]
MEATAQQEVTAVDQAMDQLATAVDHLVKVVDDGGLDHYEFSELVGFMQSFEQVRNRLPLVDHRVIADGERRGLADALSQPSMRRVLVHLLRLAPGEASRRVAAAEACGTRVSMLGEVLAPRRSPSGRRPAPGSVTQTRSTSPSRRCGRWTDPASIPRRSTQRRRS